MSLHVQTVIPGREYSAPNLRRIMNTEFTKTVSGDSLLEQLPIRSMILLLKIEGNCSHLRAKPAHMVGHLPEGGGKPTGAHAISRKVVRGHQVCLTS
jgi:hypothetical protein